MVKTIVPAVQCTAYIIHSNTTIVLLCYKSRLLIFLSRQYFFHVFKKEVVLYMLYLLTDIVYNNACISHDGCKCEENDVSIHVVCACIKDVFSMKAM